MADQPTRAVQDYLKAIHALMAPNGWSRRWSIADRLEVRAPLRDRHAQAAVRGWLDRIRAGSRRSPDPPGHDRSLAGHPPAPADGIVFDRVLGLDWSEVDAEAEALEHAISPRLEQAIADHLGEPLEDPHGHLIPTREGGAGSPVVAAAPFISDWPGTGNPRSAGRSPRPLAALVGSRAEARSLCHHCASPGSRRHLRTRGGKPEGDVGRGRPGRPVRRGGISAEVDQITRFERSTSQSQSVAREETATGSESSRCRVPFLHNAYRASASAAAFVSGASGPLSPTWPVPFAPRSKSNRATSSQPCCTRPRLVCWLLPSFPALEASDRQPPPTRAPVTRLPAPCPALRKADLDPRNLPGDMLVDLFSPGTGIQNQDVRIGQRHRQTLAVGRNSNCLARLGVADFCHGLFQDERLIHLEGMIVGHPKDIAVRAGPSTTGFFRVSRTGCSLLFLEYPRGHSEKESSSSQRVIVPVLDLGRRHFRTLSRKSSATRSVSGWKEIGLQFMNEFALRERVATNFGWHSIVCLVWKLESPDRFPGWSRSTGRKWLRLVGPASVHSPVLHNLLCVP